MVGAPSWASLIMDRTTRRVSGKDGPGISVYQKPLLLSDETCGSSATSPVNNNGNWVINQLPINAYETTETISNTPVSYVTNCGLKLFLNKGLDENNRVANVQGSILIQVLDKIDSPLVSGTDKGVLQVAQFDWKTGSSVKLDVTVNKLAGDLTAIPNADISKTFTDPVTLAVDDFDEGLIQFDVKATVTQPDGDVIEFGVMQVLINKTSNIDANNDYMRPDEKLF